jgi:hypothetical protein
MIICTIVAAEKCIQCHCLFSCQYFWFSLERILDFQKRNFRVEHYNMPHVTFFGGVRNDNNRKATSIKTLTSATEANAKTECGQHQKKIGCRKICQNTEGHGDANYNNPPKQIGCVKRPKRKGKRPVVTSTIEQLVFPTAPNNVRVDFVDRKRKNIYTRSTTLTKQPIYHSGSANH